MKAREAVLRPGGAGRATLVRLGVLLAASLATATAAAAQVTAGADVVTPEPAPEPVQAVWSWDPMDPRIGLGPEGEAIWNLEHLANTPRPEGFATNSDLAFGRDLLFLGNYNGFNIYDVSNPRSPTLRVSVLCPGNQGDLSVHGNLLFKSVQAASSRLDCGLEGAEGDVNPERFRGVRIFDITDVENPRQVAAVQTCRGSHTHSLASHPDDPANIYVYVSGTSGVRPGEELPGCSGAPPEDDPNTSLFQIEVIRVPLANPEQAAIVSEPRVFADRETGAIAGLRSVDREGIPDSPVRACHDITTYPAIGLAGGACSGNGLILDISDPTNPTRLTEVADANFAYWHSATFNNDGTSVVFTDEWGGGGSPRCREIDPPTWGANAIFDLIDGRELRHRSYYKLPVPQTEQENCVAHNGSLIPVPGRDIMVQAWYAGGISIFDFTDPGNPHEIAYFDRGPGGGFWSVYWHNGYIYGSEMRRGLDVFRLTPNEHLSQNEIDAAMSVIVDDFNPQHQQKIVWPVSFAVTRSYVDQLERSGALEASLIQRLRAELGDAERLTGNQRSAAADRMVASAAELDRQALAELTAGRTGDATRVRAVLASSLRDLAATLR
jgi:hypothetical protein